MIHHLISAILLPAVPAVPAGPAAGLNDVEYRIEARLDESAEVLHGRGELRYTSGVEAPLDTLWLHQHLNAFRPNSAWAQREASYGQRRFQDLGEDEHAYERFTRVEIDGTPVQPVYPFAPDSTVVGLPLPRTLATGQSTVVSFDWEARPSTTPRRQGRQGRRYDFAQWYPRVAVLNENGWHVQPLLPQGEFFGEFGTYDVVLDVAGDQVIGATGVPIEGDPGWANNARPGFDQIPDLRGVYEVSPWQSLGLLEGYAAADRKRVRWRAEEVHHFGWSVNPEYIYEGGMAPRDGDTPVAIHVLYLPGDLDWADGAALRRTINALGWLQDLFGPYPWPQLTNLHRIESGGTEFPMMMMNGSPSDGLIMHETAHQYVHGILANNEFDEGWLDEGFASFLTNWYHEENGRPEVWEASLVSILQFERAGATVPIAMPGAEFPNPNTYSAMTYTKAELVFRMLRWMVGEETMREILRTYYDRHALGHVFEEDFRQVASGVAGEDLDWFFDQWLHTTEQLDYSVAEAVAAQSAEGEWTTRVTVQRAGGAWMPVDLRVGDVVVRLESRDPVQSLEVTTTERPREAVLDPDLNLIDVDPGNNRAAVVVR